MDEQLVLKITAKNSKITASISYVVGKILYTVPRVLVQYFARDRPYTSRAKQQPSAICVKTGKGKPHQLWRSVMGLVYPEKAFSRAIPDYRPLRTSLNRRRACLTDCSPPSTSQHHNTSEGKTYYVFFPF